MLGYWPETTYVLCMEQNPNTGYVMRNVQQTYV